MSSQQKVINTYKRNRHKMIKENVHIQVRQCTNLIGNVFWNTMIVEHKLAKDGKFTANEDDADNHHDVYCKAATKLRFVPRAPLIDLEADSLDVIKTSPIGRIFKPDNFIFGVSDIHNNWAKEHYTEGTELIDEVVDAIRREAKSHSSTVFSKFEKIPE